ncbi:hypothetical protein EMCRGX_G032035 [Ephydatia muelleri]|eukprot:Em0019g778a
MTSESATSPKVFTKIVLVGDCRVGKSSILLRLVEGQLPPDGPPQTLGIDYRTHSIDIDGEKVDLRIWDTAGQERYKSITQGYYKGAAAALIIYDPTDVESFASVTNWLKDIETYGSETITLMLIENKCDLKKTKPRKIAQRAGEDLAASHRILFKETSALDGTNIQAAFEDVVRVLRNTKGVQSTGGKDTVFIHKVPVKPEEKCSC